MMAQHQMALPTRIDVLPPMSAISRRSHTHENTAKATWSDGQAFPGPSTLRRKEAASGVQPATTGTAVGHR